MQPAVFLDRDGVINRSFVRGGKPYPPRNVGDLEILPGVSDALASLKSTGYSLIVVTNQPDVARGTISKSQVKNMNEWLQSRLPLDLILTCFHDDIDQCDCRKPKPGLLLKASLDLQIDLPTSYMVGDRWRDIEAGREAGCKTIFIDYGYNEKQPESYDFSVACLLEAARQIILQ